MRLLLDTHALLWLLADDQRLGHDAREVVTDRRNTVWVSVASLWEVAIKIRIGKLQADLQEVQQAADRAGLRLLSLQPEHLLSLGRLPRHADHRDPFDHLLIAQAITEGMSFVSADPKAARYPVDLTPC